MTEPAPVRVVPCSENRKTGPVAVTYVARQSCPPCPLWEGCYATFGPIRYITGALGEAAGAARPIDLARLEARLIDRLRGYLPLRLHVVGDCRTEAAARALGAAARRYRNKRGQAVWTYTHAWRTVPRSAWGDAVSVLASCEGPSEVLQAKARGYAAALIVPSFESDRVHHVGEDVRIIPCPYETRKVQCIDCRLCFDDERLLEAGLTIGFMPHGTGSRRVALALVE